MDKILVAGVNTVVGANLAETLTEHHTVIGVSFADGEYGWPALMGTAIAIAAGPVIYRTRVSPHH